MELARQHDSLFERQCHKIHYAGKFQDSLWEKEDFELYFVFTHHEWRMGVFPGETANSKRLRFLSIHDQLPIEMSPWGRQYETMIYNEMHDMTLLNKNGYVVASRFTHWFSSLMNFVVLKFNSQHDTKVNYKFKKVLQIDLNKTITFFSQVSNVTENKIFQLRWHRQNSQSILIKLRPCWINQFGDRIDPEAVKYEVSYSYLFVYKI